LEREVVKSLAQELRMETNTEVDTDRISDVKHKGLQYTVNSRRSQGRGHTSCQDGGEHLRVVQHGLSDDGRYPGHHQDDWVHAGYPNTLPSHQLAQKTLIINQRDEMMFHLDT
jgi:hypothetical protein